MSNVLYHPATRGEFRHLGTGHVPGVDEHNIKLFSAYPDTSNIQFEQNNAAVQRMQSRMVQVCRPSFLLCAHNAALVAALTWVCC